VNAAPRRGCRPDGAGEWGGAGGYEDFAPDGAANRRAEARLLALEKSGMLGVMAEHKLGPGRTLIDGLEVLGRGLGYYAKREHPVEKQSANPPAVDVAWKADEQQEFPLMIFEVESVAGNTMANNAIKVFGQSTEAFEKPLFFFHAVLSSGSDTSRIDTLKHHYGANNYRLYRLDHDETNSLVKDILSQHRRLNRKIDLVKLRELLSSEAWVQVNIDAIFEHVEKLQYQADYLGSYALLTQRDELFKKRFFNRLLAQEESMPRKEDAGYKTFIGQSWAKPVHLALLAHTFGDDKNRFLETLRNWQERSFTSSMIGPHFGLSRDYDEFVLGISPSLFALIAAVWGGSSSARDYIADQLEIILKAVSGVPDRVSFFAGIWLLHVAAGASNDRVYEFTRSFINRHGGVSAKCLYHPRFLIALDEETEWDEDFKEAAILVPDRTQFIKQVLQNYPATPTASDAASLGIDILVEPEYTDGFAERTVAMLVPRANG
jgi:hypothetical protein